MNILELYENILEVEYATRMWPDRSTACDEAMAKCKKFITDNYPEVIKEHDKNEAFRMLNFNCEQITKIVNYYADKYSDSDDLVDCVDYFIAKLRKGLLERK